LLNTNKIVTQELETNVLTINDDVTIKDDDGDDVNASSVGTITIKAGHLEAVVETSSITEDSRVFVSPKTPLNQAPAAEDIVDKKSFIIRLFEVQEKDLDIDWFIIAD
jgi:hypothetical protein